MPVFFSKMLLVHNLFRSDMMGTIASIQLSERLVCEFMRYSIYRLPGHYA